MNHHSFLFLACVCCFPLKALNTRRAPRSRCARAGDTSRRDILETQHRSQSKPQGSWHRLTHNGHPAFCVRREVGVKSRKPVGGRPQTVLTPDTIGGKQFGLTALLSPLTFFIETRFKKHSKITSLGEGKARVFRRPKLGLRTPNTTQLIDRCKHLGCFCPDQIPELQKDMWWKECSRTQVFRKGKDGQPSPLLLDVASGPSWRLARATGGLPAPAPDGRPGWPCVYASAGRTGPRGPGGGLTASSRFYFSFGFSL